MIRWIAAIAWIALAAPAAAQDAYPGKPIRIIVGYSAGGGNDIIVRVMQPELQKGLGQPVVVENRPGAQSIVAAELVAKAPADGYTLLMGPSGPMTINPATYAKLPYHPQRDFAPISMICSFPLIVVVSSGTPLKNIQDLIAYAKANPGKVRYASVGVGSNNHYDTEAFAQWAGIKLHHIPNKGGGGAIANDVLRGDVHVVLVNAASSAGLAKSGMIKVLAVMADQRLPDYPDAPTFKELGYSAGKGLWSALYAPVKTPRAVLDTLHRQTVQALNSAAVQATFGKQMIKAIPNASIADAQAWNKLEIAHWKKITELVKIDQPQ
jgi:tripartite-type tricarboxylate transporter receptor subunit TctC